MDVYNTLVLTIKYNLKVRLGNFTHLLVLNARQLNNSIIIINSSSDSSKNAKVFFRDSRIRDNLHYY